MIVKILSKENGSSFRKTSGSSMGLMLLPTVSNDTDYSEDVDDSSWSYLRARKLRDFIADMLNYVTFINASIDAMLSLRQSIENGIARKIGANAPYLGMNGAGNVLYRIDPYTSEKNPETLEVLFDELNNYKIDLETQLYFSKLKKRKSKFSNLLYTN